MFRGADMGNREFSDAIKLEVIKSNLNRNGDILCENCHKKLVSFAECHFDHIFPYAKGGESISSNCQILCVECNLKKSDKELQDFLLEEKARRFLAGESLDGAETVSVAEKSPDSKKITKETFDRAIGDFIKKKGRVQKADFGREYNHLPPIRYVSEFYGDLISLQKAFGVEDLSLTWDRETIKVALTKFLKDHGEIWQKDLNRANKLPSLPCILNYYPECKNFTDVKRILCNIDVPEQWTVENVLESGKNFVKANGKITQKDLCAANHLPAADMINKLFGSLGNFQEALGLERNQKNEYISKEDLSDAVTVYFDGKERIVDSYGMFCKTFPYSESTIIKRYGSLAEFCKDQEITVLNVKKNKYTKREVDDAISKWVKEGHPIPLAKDLSKKGLPSLSVILKYYEDWKEPFRLYEKIHEEVRRT